MGESNRTIAGGGGAAAGGGPPAAGGAAVTRAAGGEAAAAFRTCRQGSGRRRALLRCPMGGEESMGKARSCCGSTKCYHAGPPCHFAHTPAATRTGHGGATASRPPAHSPVNERQDLEGTLRRVAKQVVDARTVHAGLPIQSPLTVPDTMLHEGQGGPQRSRVAQGAWQPRGGDEAAGGRQQPRRHLAVRCPPPCAHLLPPRPAPPPAAVAPAAAGGHAPFKVRG